MTDLMMPSTECACPPWCVHADQTGEHTHVTADVRADVGGGGQGPTAQLVQTGTDGPVAVVDGRAVALDERGQFVRGLQRLLDEARLAPPGTEPVDDLVARSGLGLSEVARAAGLEVAWVRAQHAGRQVLTVAEFRRLAQTAASLAETSRAG
jgi:hypothetical protein